MLCINLEQIEDEQSQVEVKFSISAVFNRKIWGTKDTKNMELRQPKGHRSALQNARCCGVSYCSFFAAAGHES